MEFFNEKNGRYFAKAGNMGIGGKPVIAIAMGILPIIIFGAIFLLTPQDQGKGDITNNIHIIIAAGIFVLANLIGFFIRKAGLGSGITVDQMERTITFKRPGTQRRTMNIDSIQKILLKTIQGSAAMLSLTSLDGNNHLLSVSRNPDQMRRMADELSTLTSITVYEETMQRS
ncbi:MAG: hypothetical protein KAS73_07190 [Candidatus Sabulitectum sp.]|nr:hypothetical protein [Candidatus Sabulitectum sp.]